MHSALLHVIVFMSTFRDWYENICRWKIWNLGFASKAGGAVDGGKIDSVIGYKLKFLKLNDE